MNRKIRNLRTIAAAMTLVAVLGGAVAPAAHAGPKTTGGTTDSGKKWK